MSFSQDLKTELIQGPPGSHDERVALTYGLLLAARHFSASRIELVSESADILVCFAGLLTELFDAPLDERPQQVAVREAIDCRRIFDFFGGTAGASVRVNRALIDTSETRAAFAKGLFLGCGSVSDPQKGYHLEFSLPFLNLSRDVESVLTESGFAPKRVQRGGGYIIYLKDSEQIEDLLTMMGASAAALQIMNIKVYKDLRNKVNRIMNCEAANIEKMVRAAGKQIENINAILRQKGELGLPGDLLELARLRLQNPEMSLQELGALMNPAVSRSGVSRRFSRIAHIAEELSPTGETHD